MADVNPVAGRDDPKTWVQFEDWFATEDACVAYLEKLRWPGGFCCPACGVMDSPVRASRRRLVCRSCAHQCSVTAGTIFDKTRTPLRVWFAAAWHITSQKHGVSALGLQRVLGLSSYQTAWAMLHRFRRAMVRPQRDKLAGTVEVDEAYLALSRGPRVKSGKTSSKAHDHSHLITIAVAVEVHDPKGFGRIRIHRVQGPTIGALIPFARENVMPGATIRTDGSAIYGPLQEDGFGHEPFVQLGSKIPAHVSLPGVHRVIALLKRWLLGTHQGAVDPRHVDYYLDEFAFRFNRRSSRSRGMLFYRLLQQSIATMPTTYANLRDNEHPEPPASRFPRSVELNG